VNGENRFIIDSIAIAFVVAPVVTIVIFLARCPKDSIVRYGCQNEGNHCVPAKSL
jgi:hypothetical protein